MPVFLKRLRLLTRFEGFFVANSQKGRAHLNPLVLALFLALHSYARAQSPTVTTLTATPAGALSGSIVTMTANVSSGGVRVTGGTVSFHDPFASADLNPLVLALFLALHSYARAQS